MSPPVIITGMHRSAASLLASMLHRAGLHLGHRPAWGWRDPRTTLFLDFWRSRAPDARFVFVYRRPAEVNALLERLDVLSRRASVASHGAGDDGG